MHSTNEVEKSHGRLFHSIVEKKITDDNDDDKKMILYASDIHCLKVNCKHGNSSDKSY